MERYSMLKTYMLCEIIDFTANIFSMRRCGASLQYFLNSLLNNNDLFCNVFNARRICLLVSHQTIEISSRKSDRLPITDKSNQTVFLACIIYFAVQIMVPY